MADEATVEVEDDSTDQFPETSKFDSDSDSNQPESSFVNDVLQHSVEFIEHYGWFILIFAVVLYIILTKRNSRSSGGAAQSRQSQQASSPKSEKLDEKDAAARERHIEAMMRARERQQAENNRLVEEYRAIQQAKQAEREAEQLAEYERLYGKSEGQRLGSAAAKPNDSQQSAPKPSSSARLRPDNYMPLGGAGSGSYRPGGARSRPGARSS